MVLRVGVEPTELRFLAAYLCQFGYQSIFGAVSGTRTHTTVLLRHVPLPIGLPRHLGLFPPFVYILYQKF